MMMMMMLLMLLLLLMMMMISVVSLLDTTVLYFWMSGSVDQKKLFLLATLSGNSSLGSICLANCRCNAESGPERQSNFNPYQSNSTFNLIAHYSF